MFREKNKQFSLLVPFEHEEVSRPILRRHELMLRHDAEQPESRPVLLFLHEAHLEDPLRLSPLPREVLLHASPSVAQECRVQVGLEGLELRVIGEVNGDLGAVRLELSFHKVPGEVGHVEGVHRHGCGAALDEDLVEGPEELPGRGAQEGVQPVADVDGDAEDLAASL